MSGHALLHKSVGVMMLLELLAFDEEELSERTSTTSSLNGCGRFPPASSSSRNSSWLSSELLEFVSMASIKLDMMG